MKEEIGSLKANLIKCENKWNKIVKSTLRENVDLKDENKRLKNMIKELNNKINTTFSSI